MTSPERWQRIEEVFQSAIDQPPERRLAFVAETCGDDVELRSLIENLLSRDWEESPVIAHIIDEATSELLDGESVDEANG